MRPSLRALHYFITGYILMYRQLFRQMPLHFSPVRRVMGVVSVMSCVAILLVLFFSSSTFSSRFPNTNISAAAIGSSRPPESDLLQHITNATLGVSAAESFSYA
jgi:hypothetical protein